MNTAKKTMKYLTIVDTCGTLRKDHFAEDYAEMVKIQESSAGKRRFYIHYEGFSEIELENMMKFALLNNNLRNFFLRKNTYVNYSSITFKKLNEYR